jgi:amidophosphoribosyltransferase
LAAANQSIEEIAKGIDADSLEYLSLEGLDAVACEFGQPEDFCHACFTGRYPTKFLPRSR